ncbi:hypothetical protein LCGC14_1501840, partial [marine sediment metagenome]
DDALVIEYAYNTTGGVVRSGWPTYGSLLGAWYQTFSDDGNGPAVINDATYAWLASGAAGPAGGAFGAGNFWLTTLGAWKTGLGTPPVYLDANTLVTGIEIEVDNWIAQSEAYVDNITITGVIVTQDAGSGATGDNFISLSGNVSVRSVGLLPDESQYAGLHEKTGTFMVAPGFEASFAGNFGIISGAMAAEHFTFTGNAGGTLGGPLISWGEGLLSLTGNTRITIDRSGGTDMTPGFTGGSGGTTFTLTPLRSTYKEPVE